MCVFQDSLYKGTGNAVLILLRIRIILKVQYHTYRHCEKALMNLFKREFFGVEIIINNL